MAIDPRRHYRRREAAAALREIGIPISASSMATGASRGRDMPPFRRFGRVPLYLGEDLLAWIEARLTALVRSTAELDALRQSDRAPPS
ncbi:MAG: hypothetical protein ACREFB_01495 [Stellaceae bacterium]